MIVLRTWIPAWPLLEQLPKAPRSTWILLLDLGYLVARWQVGLSVSYGRTRVRFLGSSSSSSSTESAFVKLDVISGFVIVASLSIFLFIGLFGPTAMITSTYVNSLTISGLVVGYAAKTVRGSPLDPIPRDGRRKILIFAGIGFVGILLSNGLVNAIPVNLGVLPTGNSGQIETVEISAAEEVWFRGVFAPLLVRTRLGLYGGLGLQGGLFGTYHLAAYGDNFSALLIIALSGFVLGYIDIKSGRLAPSMISHFVINLFASGVL